MNDPNNRRRRRGRTTEQQPGAEFDAAPGSFDSSFGSEPTNLTDEREPAQELPFAPKRSSSKNGKKPSSVRETRIWKDATDSVARFWGNYISALRIAFNRFDRRGQEELIIRMSQIMTIGAAIVTTYIWYWFMPQAIRVVVLPLVLVASWWAGTKIVGPSMIGRFDKHLHPRDDEEDDYYDEQDDN